MKRLPNWEPRLLATVREWSGAEHRYGSRDCMLWAAAAVKAVTGEDLAKGHRGRYRSAAGAARYLRGLGFDSPAAMVAAHLPEIPAALARRGDIVADPDGVPGVCLGAKVAFVGAEGSRPGLVTRPTVQCGQAWRVGDE